jgi:protease IV
MKRDSKIWRLGVLLVIFVSGAFAQLAPGTGVAVSDNLDGFISNPAGLAVPRAWQMGFSGSYPDLNAIDTAEYWFSFNSDGIGSYVVADQYGDYSYGFSLAASLGKGVYTGVNWHIKEKIDLGLMVRPFNWLSTGAVANLDHRGESLNSLQAGLALRPFKHYLTFGADVKMDALKDYQVSNLPLFAEAEPVKGIRLRAGYDLETEQLSAGLALHIAPSMGLSYQIKPGDDVNSGAFDILFEGHDRQSIINPDGGNYWARLKLDGLLIEEPPLEKNPFNLSVNLNPFAGPAPRIIQLRKFIDELQELTADKNLQGLIIDLGNFSGGFQKLAELREALENFKKSGKKIIVYSKYGISNSNYFLISLADEIYVHELAGIDLRGIMVEMTYFKTLLDTLDIVAEVERISPYKSAMDPFINTGISDEVRENWGQLFGDIFEYFTESIASGRGWSKEQTKSVIDSGPYSANDALKAQLINGFMYPDEFEKYVSKLDGKKTKIKAWRKLFHPRYEREWRPDKSKPVIAIVYAVGNIMTGKSKPGITGSSVMGDETISKAIKRARKNKDVKAIVLRIDSGGGSALASDLMWREVLATTDRDTANVKPLIASMSDVAASGGYYIAMQADTIVAGPGTITGSIGVISGRVNVSPLLERIGIHFDRMKFGENSDFYSMRLWTEEERQRVHKDMFEIYQTFINKVAQGRESLDTAAVHAVGAGRVWSGSRAKTHQLVDEVGGLIHSINVAKAAAGIDADQDVYILEYPRAESAMEKMLQKDEEQSRIQLLDSLFPEWQKVMAILPVFLDEDPYLIMPYQIEIK